VQLDAGDAHYVLCDLGSGVRAFGNHALATRRGQPGTYHIFMSHTPLGPHRRVSVLHAGLHPRQRDHHLRLSCRAGRGHSTQHGAPSFPVEFAQLGAEIRFVRLEPDRPYDLAGFRVTAKRQRHTGDSYGYRFERDGRVVIYSTDSEHKLDDPAATRAFAEFFRDADLVIFDAQYSLADSISIKEDWGHSSNVVGVELCQMARARHLCMFHHEPTYDDAKIAAVLAETRRLEEITRDGHTVQVSAAWDGMEIEL
jgi:hypothetical protein